MSDEQIDMGNPGDPVKTTHRMVCVLKEDWEAAQAELERLQGLVEPVGTKMERLGRLVECAKRMGFIGAHKAFWDNDSPEYPIEYPTDVTEAGDVGRVYCVDIGLFLGDAVYAIFKANVGGEDYKCFVCDTEAAAREAGKEQP